MKKAPIPKNENERLEALRKLGVLDTPTEEKFDRITDLASKIFKTPISTLTLIDSEREWFKSVCGVEESEGDRAISFCGHALLDDEILVVPDTKEDSRFKDNPMVVGSPYIRFYAGVPILSADSYRIGVFCIKDTKPRKFKDEDKFLLIALARWSESELNLNNLSKSLNTIRGFEIERVKQEKKLKESNEKISATLRSIGDGVIVVDNLGLVTNLNRVAEKLTGWNLSEAKGKSIEEVFNIVDGKNYETQLNPVFRAMEKGEIMEMSNSVVLIARDKRKKYQIADSCAPIKVDDDKIIGAVLVFRDVTFDYKQRELLRESEQKLIEAQKLALMGRWDYYHADSRFEWSESTFDIFEKDLESFSPNIDDFLSMIHSDDQEMVKKAWENSLQNKVDCQIEYRIVMDDDRVKWIGEECRTFFDENSKPIRSVGVVQDITRQKEVNQAKTEFVSLASHQLKTPVGAVKWNIEMLLSGDYGDLKPKQKEVLSDVYNLNERMGELVKGFLNVSRVDLGIFSIEPVVVNYSDVSDEVLSELKNKIETKKINVNVEYQKNLPETIADTKLLRIIFQNLLSNAVKYTSNKGNVTVKIGADDKEIKITVSDDGVGISADEKECIYSKLYRASNAQEIDPDGNGLGLYLLKEITERAGGRTWFESELNVGTTFYVTFPLPGMQKKKGEKKLS